MHGRGGMCGRYYEIRSMSGRYTSYWNAFLYLIILWVCIRGGGGRGLARPPASVIVRDTAKKRAVFSRRKVQKLRGQSQYISKNVRALQYWRWACGTCCKQYHMLFYIQMAVVSTAIFFLFSPSFSFFLEIKVQIYIYFHNKCQYINQFPPKP